MHLTYKGLTQNIEGCLHINKKEMDKAIEKWAKLKQTLNKIKYLVANLY